MKKYVVNDIHEYIDLITELNSDGKNRWFRGQSSAKYHLTPSFIRDDYVFAIRSARGEKIIPPILAKHCSRYDPDLVSLPVRLMVDEFKNQTKDLLEYKVDSYIEWECIAQHYGIPTHMMDWTSNALNALYFAVFDCQINETKTADIEDFKLSGFAAGGGAVYIVEPSKINAIAGQAETVFDIGHVRNANELEKHEDSISPPIFIHGLNKEKRIARQGGNFSVTSTFWKSMDTIDAIEKEITKIYIPYTSYEMIRDQMISLGITHEYIYVEEDEKDEIARKIANSIKNEFISKMKDIK